MPHGGGTRVVMVDHLAKAACVKAVSSATRQRTTLPLRNVKMGGSRRRGQPIDACHANRPLPQRVRDSLARTATLLSTPSLNPLAQLDLLSRT